MSTFTQFLLLFLAGGCGTLSRFGLSRLFSFWTGTGTPWGTSIINIVGCLCFGIIAEMFNAREHWSPETRTIILTGFFGAFTTFSTYMYELHSLYEKGSLPLALAGFTVQNIIGFAAVLIGVFIVRQLNG